MASSSSSSTFINMITFFIILSPLLVQPSLAGDLVCEELEPELCAYSVSSSGKRCVLENYMPWKGAVEYQCKTSEVVTTTMKEWIETEECVNDCGLDRSSVGISSDYLLYPKFVAKLCSWPCLLSCPNVVDLYSNLAQAEGMDLMAMCSIQGSNPRRSLFRPQSSSDADAVGSPQSNDAALLSDADADAAGPSADIF